MGLMDQNSVRFRPSNLGRLLLDPLSTQALSWMGGYFSAHPTATLRLPIQAAPEQNPLDDVPVPPWPYGPSGAACEQALTTFEQAGLLSRNGGAGYAQTPLARKLLPWQSLSHQRNQERLFDRFPEIRASVSGRRLLECGCGTGAYSIALYALGPRHMTAMEYSSAALDVTRTVLGSVGAEVGYSIGSIERLPFEDNSFDFVFCRGVLPLVHNGRSMRELARVMTPGGALLVMLHSPSYYWFRIRQAGLSRDRMRYFAMGWLGLLGGLSLSWLGREPHWKLMAANFYLCYESRRAFQNLCQISGLVLERWEPGMKPYAWVRKPKAG